MAVDMALELIHATVQLEQPLGDGTRTVGTGFLIAAPGPDGEPRTVLITAHHVFQKMPGANARIGYRIANADGSWSYSPQPLKIRDGEGHELWTHHPGRDVAAIAIKAPPEFAKAAIPLAYLASDATFQANRLNTGDEIVINPLVDRKGRLLRIIESRTGLEFGYRRNSQRHQRPKRRV